MKGATLTSAQLAEQKAEKGMDCLPVERSATVEHGYWHTIPAKLLPDGLRNKSLKGIATTTANGTHSVMHRQKRPFWHSEWVFLVINLAVRVIQLSLKPRLYFTQFFDRTANV